MHDMKKKATTFAPAILVAAFTMIIYLPALQNDFVNWDDEQYIIYNSHIQTINFNFIKWAFFDFYAANWHPLTWFSHALDYAVWGLNPLGHHLSSIILHGLNTMLVIILIIKLLNSAKTNHSEKDILALAIITGLLFGLHPLHVESVAWVSEKKDVLYSFFFLLSLLSYLGYALDYRNRQRDATSFHLIYANRKYLAAIGLFALSLMSKPMALTLPFVLLILDYYPLQRLDSLKNIKYLIIEKIPFFILSAACSVLVLLAQASSRGNITALQVLSFQSRITIAFKSLIAYIGKMILPAELIPLYKHPVRVSLLSLEYLSAIILCTAITTLCILYAKKQRVFLAVWAYYVISLSPVLGIVQVGRQAMADRYTYLTSLGHFFLAALLIVHIYAKITEKNALQFYKKLIFYTLMIALFSTFSYLTVKQIRFWKDGITLWSHEIRIDPLFPEPYHRRGNAFRVIGEYDNALDDLTTAIRLNPMTEPDYYNDRGIVYATLKKFPMALNDFNTALLLAPENPTYRKNLLTATKAFEYYEKIKTSGKR
ncbi:MAG: Tetratricopeptide TPR2 repeat protein [Nitrospirae bacterium]|nr:MAG: Tetratricopeptide TPR2 repeat protein [Nitrospirota bacterium]